MASENSLRYLKLDFQSHKDALIQRVRSRWPTVWNDFLANSLGILLIDIIAWSTATLAYVINRAAAENFITTMTLRESAIRLGSFVGYNLRGPTPATLQCEVVLPGPATSQVKISKGTLIRAGDDALPFEVIQDYAIMVGKTTPENTAAAFSQGLTGTKTVSSNVVVTGGSAYVDVIDSTVDLTQLIQPGMTFRVSPSVAGEQIYTVQAIESSPGAISKNRMVITPPWSGQIADAVEDGATSEVQAEVYDRRIALIQGQTISDRYVTPAVEVPGYTAKLSRTPVIDGSVSVTVNGEAWTQVQSVRIEPGDSKVYQVSTLPSGDTVAQFGDGQFGSIVPTEGSVVITYRIGGGVAGNLAIGTVNTSITATSGKNVISVTLRNDTSQGQGGRNPESLEEARVSIPYHIRTNGRAVTLDDYQTLAQQYSHQQYGSVAYARAHVRTENSLLEGNIVFIYAWTTGASGLTTLQPQLKTALKEYLQTKAVGTDYIVIGDGTSRPVPLSLRFKTYSGFDVFATTNLVTDTIKSMVETLRPGSPLVYSDLVRKLDEVYGVDSVNMASPISDLMTTTPMELFTAPDDSFNYVLDAVTNEEDGTGGYFSQMPVSPLRAWSFQMFLNGSQLTVIPHTIAGQARILCNGIIDETRGPSYVNLLTGKIKWYPVQSGSKLTVRLISVQGYDRERPIDVFIGYTGDNTIVKRREIRAALRSWSDNLTIGGAMFAGDPTNLPNYDTHGIPASMSNIAAVVKAIVPGATIARVALGTPSSTDDRINAMGYELLTVGKITINNQID